MKDKIKQNPSPNPSQKNPPKHNEGFGPYRILVGLVLFANSLFVLPNCLDTSLTPRFFFLSLSLLITLAWAWKDLIKNADWRLNGFDLLFLGWYGMNAASVFWAFSWSEAVFYTQKVFLAFVVYWMFRQALLRDEATVRKAIRQATVALTFIVSGIVLVQLAQAVGKVGLNNEELYDYARGVYGNKGLASDFLFFLLVFNLLFLKEIQPKWLALAGIALLSGLLLVLQTRTVYLAALATALLYFPVRAWIEPAFKPYFLKKILPIGVLFILLLTAFVALKGKGSSLAERLNPATYLESASANERRFVWYKTDLLNAEHPWIGVGNGSWKLFFPSKSIQGAYRLQEKSIVFTRAHNDYLEIRSEMGLLGVGLFIALFIAAFWAGIRVLLKMESLPNRYDLLVLMLGLVGYCIIQYFDFPRERIEMQVVLSLFFAYIAFRARGFWAQRTSLNIKRMAPVFLSAFALGLVFSLIIGFYRIKGEVHNVKIMEAQGMKNWEKSISEARLSENLFYEYNDVALPIKWYEGIGYYQQKKFKEASAAFGRAYELNPWSFQVINNYASAMVQSGSISEAIKMYEKTLVINPKYDEGKFNLSYTYYELGDFKKALEYVQSVDTIPNPKTADEFKKNEAVLKKKTEFIRLIQSKAGGSATQ